MGDNKIRVVVADDQADIRSAFRLIVDSQPDMVVAGEAADGASALDVARRLGPDVMLMDIRMPRMDGLEVTQKLLNDPRTAGVRVIVVTTFTWTSTSAGLWRSAPADSCSSGLGPPCSSRASGPR